MFGGRQSDPSYVCYRKELEQREKEAEEFYKSDSDDSGTSICRLGITKDCSVASTGNGTNVLSTDICDNDTNSATDIFSTPTKICSDNSVSDTIVPSVSNRDINICVSEIGTPDSRTSAVGISANNIEITIPNSNSGADVSSSGAIGSSTHTSICTQETGARGSVPNDETTSLSSIHVADNNSDMKLGQSQLAEDSCNFQLHYSESQSVDVRGPELVTHSSLDDDGSNAMDICLEVANTEDLALHYTETQDTEHSLMDAENEPQKEERTMRWENLQPPSSDSEGDDDKAKTVLQSLARRSLPGLGDITRLKPRLSGAPDGMIELDEDESGPAGVVKLVERFMKHSTAKRPIEKKHTVEVGYVCQFLCPSTKYIAPSVEHLTSLV